MHRTQLLLEEWQYETLRARAEREGRSLSALVRELLQNSMPQPVTSSGRIDKLEGIGEDTGAYGKDHDRFLYGVRQDGT